MERAKRLSSLWNYLPVFRVVAETEHISRSAKRLHVTPSAVSRSLAALESDVGQPLFDRHGRSMRLNDAGQHLLLGVRTAMRVIDESLLAVSGETLVGRVRLASFEPFTSSLLPALLAELVEAHPTLVPVVLRIDESDVPDALLDGRIDVAFSRLAAPRPQLACVTLARLSTSAYVASGHPLAIGAPTTARLRAARYVEVGQAPTSHAGAWANDRGLQAALSVADFDLAHAMVVSSAAIALLPDVLVATKGAATKLKRLTLPAPPDVVSFAISRAPQATRSRADVVVALAARQARDAHGAPA